MSVIDGSPRSVAGRGNNGGCGRYCAGHARKQTTQSACCYQVCQSGAAIFAQPRRTPLHHCRGGRRNRSRTHTRLRGCDHRSERNRHDSARKPPQADQRWCAAGFHRRSHRQHAPPEGITGSAGSCPCAAGNVRWRAARFEILPTDRQHLRRIRRQCGACRCLESGDGWFTRSHRRTDLCIICRGAVVQRHHRRSQQNADASSQSPTAHRRHTNQRDTCSCHSRKVT
jgi:hypothetical protein